MMVNWNRFSILMKHGAPVHLAPAE